MDQNRFDDLTRSLATTTSRRQALKLLGLLGGGLLAALIPGTALAKGPRCFAPFHSVCETPCTGRCVCLITLEQNPFCFDVAGLDRKCDSTCTSSVECPLGQRCIMNNCCGHAVCAPVC